MKKLTKKQKQAKAEKEAQKIGGYVYTDGKTFWVADSKLENTSGLTLVSRAFGPISEEEKK